METFEYRILEELKKINDRLDKLEQRQIYPFQPYTPSTPIQPVINPSSKCSKCGLKLEGFMGYACPHRDCPCGMGPVWCSTSELK